MTPQLVDHAHTDSCVVIGCNLAENEHVYFWLQSHRSCIAEKRDQTGECPKQAKKNTRIARQTNPDRQIDAYTDCAARSTNTVISQWLGRAGDRTNLAACICTETNHYGVLGLYLHDRFMHSNCELGTQVRPIRMHLIQTGFSARDRHEGEAIFHNPTDPANAWPSPIQLTHYAW